MPSIFDGLIKRQVTESAPPIAHYELTPIGESVLPHMIQMKEWVGEYYSRIEESRREYDGKHIRV
ncbi:winged helix-turn-helix transcriptional regulator [Paenibacillus zanthoxyli]|uniref:winged helix-turn-helix transcriptional regulator n=1 Tax=Paenibacillus zanthoxyli TaxID=369399 RepID=UPI0009FCF916